MVVNTIYQLSLKFRLKLRRVVTRKAYHFMFCSVYKYEPIHVYLFSALDKSLATLSSALENFVATLRH